jgi:hypothetical protein
MSDIAWVSTAFLNFDIGYRLTSDLSIADRDAAINLSRLYAKALPFPHEKLPKEFYPVYQKVKLNALPPFFQSERYWFLREDCADVFRHFDLGQGGLHPVKLYNFDRKSIASDTCSILIYGGQKQALLPDRMKHLSMTRLVYPDGPVWEPNESDLKDGDVVLSPAALEGTDVWRDPQFGPYFFMSDRLAKALQAKGFDKGFRLRRCQIEGDV